MKMAVQARYGLPQFQNFSHRRLYAKYHFIIYGLTKIPLGLELIIIL